MNAKIDNTLKFINTKINKYEFLNKIASNKEVFFEYDNLSVKKENWTNEQIEGIFNKPILRLELLHNKEKNKEREYYFKVYFEKLT
jgi:hypothetical protein